MQAPSGDILHLKQQILDILTNIFLKNGISLANIASEIIIKNNNIGFSIDISGQNLKEIESLRAASIKQINEIHDIGKISIILTSGKSLEKPKAHIENVKKIILVASGKGGVGKSTMAVALAENLIVDGYKTGLVDADIYGPSIPLMFNLKQKPDIIDNKIIPLCARGLQINSIGFLTNTEAPLAWRGPMASKAIYQLLSLTAWDDLDYLIVDMPPGTGDIHLAILTNYHIDGALIVTTPQKMSSIDAAKSIELYQKFDIPILSLIENMSYFIDSNGQKIEIFKDSCAKELTGKYNIPAIYQIPINPKIGEACDEGSSLKDLIRIII